MYSPLLLHPTFVNLWNSVIGHIVENKNVIDLRHITSVDGQARRIWTNCQEKRNTRASSRREPV